MISRWVPQSAWVSLGTDGFGRSDTRQELRRFFAIDAEHVAAAVLSGLARCGQVGADTAAAGIAALGIDTEAPFALRH
jgi:pyruvate dehydrogenase E1 component